MNVTLTGLVTGATYKAFYAAKAQPFVDQLMQVPSAAYASGAAAVVTHPSAPPTSELTLDLPVGQEMLVQGPNGYARRVLNSTTKGGPP